MFSIWRLHISNNKLELFSLAPAVLCFLLYILDFSLVSFLNMVVLLRNIFAVGSANS